MTVYKQQCFSAFRGYFVWVLPCVLVVFCGVQAAADYPDPDPRDYDVFWNHPNVNFTPINEMQGVDISGVKTWTIPTYSLNQHDQPFLDPANGLWQAYKLRGVVLNDPAKMLDGTANYNTDLYDLGGLWQVYIQAIDRPDTPVELAGDIGGAALWMGQNCGNLPWVDPGMNYSNEEWNLELDRLNFPTYLTGEHAGEQVDSPLRPGDLIEIHARGAMEYNGKFNCNEQHCNAAEFDFDIYVVERNLALPLTDIELSDVKTSEDTFIFDNVVPTREFGGEFYQSRRVRLHDVTITNSGDWAAYGKMNVTDGTRNFEVRLGDNTSFDITSAPDGLLDIIGIFDQEGDPTVDYRMWALSPDDFLSADLLPGDANSDGIVNDIDATIMATNWNTLHDAYWKHGDFNNDGQVNSADAALLASHWLQTTPSNAAVPEPGMLLLLATGGLMFMAWRK